MRNPMDLLKVHDIPPDLFAVLLNASRISLQELIVTVIEGLQEFAHFSRQYLDATDPTWLKLQILRTMTLRICHPLPRNLPIWPFDDAVEILDMASTSILAALNVEFGSSVLAQLADDLPQVLDNSSLQWFEQSIFRFTAHQTAVSFLPEHQRKNRSGFWTPVLTRAFPLLYGQGKLIQSSQ